MTEILRTPEERFQDLPGYPFTPRYVEVEGLRVHYVDEGPAAADPLLLLHGEPSWSFLYRKMIPLLAAGGHRVIAPDLVGFGRSDKLADRRAYTYERHVEWAWRFMQALGLKRVTLMCQDWGGLIGLRLAAEHPERFVRICAANTFLPMGTEPFSEAFLRWRTFSQEVPVLPVSGIVAKGCTSSLAPEVLAAYDAPFPEESYKAGARQFPLLVPTSPEAPGAAANRAAWEVLCRWEKPFLTAFSDRDPITRGADQVLQSLIPGAQGLEHTVIAGAGHFLQEDAGEQLARVLLAFCSQH